MTTDELRTKFEAWMADHDSFFDYIDFSRDRHGDYIGLETNAAFNAYASRDAEVEALRKDAERYRLLRSCSGYQAPFCVTQNIGHDWIISRREELDEAIDAAMKDESRNHS